MAPFIIKMGEMYAESTKAFYLGDVHIIRQLASKIMAVLIIPKTTVVEIYVMEPCTIISTHLEICALSFDFSAIQTFHEKIPRIIRSLHVPYEVLEYFGLGLGLRLRLWINLFLVLANTISG